MGMGEMTSEDFVRLKKVIRSWLDDLKEQIEFASNPDDLINYVRKYIELVELYHAVEDAEKRLLKKGKGK